MAAHVLAGQAFEYKLFFLVLLFFFFHSSIWQKCANSNSCSFLLGFWCRCYLPIQYALLLYLRKTSQPKLLQV